MTEDIVLTHFVYRAGMQGVAPLDWGLGHSPSFHLSLLPPQVAVQKK